ncbi:hypothetical protein BX616_009311 [Lobosporangium transversale]|uniref:BTB domain-containing protein n=1 Tax=Lobosporangium transversale TaxID=64571 RepID=A0A1Y2GQE9_9FUNG|nr:hypothetical protein BCR41DRAFT_421323 [Lobosporangium transversale]KAF9913919.1 hypothetical protein BX616_009311 [Lobosporangium transversale]ORZ19126.1 hypothetical protein BCR41DRAFT_421323 [Lobosporangium transversale]|eukprot:XP_021882294.1 hypothetical protein BCR41DRAFT_421323 [Lobosporangium transversale]
MRTADLIHLLRSHERSLPSTYALLASLGVTRRLHLLGELSNWLLVELQKYHGRQQQQRLEIDHDRNHHNNKGNSYYASTASTISVTPSETPQQRSIRSQIKHTLLGIQILLDTADENVTNNNNNNNVSSSGNSSNDTLKTLLPLDEKQKTQIFASFLKPILIGTMPLGGPNIDTTDVQLLCAKILSFCTHPNNNASNPTAVVTPLPTSNALCPPYTFAMRLMTYESPAAPGNDDISIKSTAPQQLAVSGIMGLSALLGSPLVKLQEYGLRILTSYRSLVQLDATWEMLDPLKRVLERLEHNLASSLSTDLLELSPEKDPNDDNKDQDKDKNKDNDGGKQTTSSLASAKTKTKTTTQELEMAINTQAKALSLLQWFFQEAEGDLLAKKPTDHTVNRTTAPTMSDSTTTITTTAAMTASVTKVEKLKDAALPELLIDIWETIQHIVLFNNRSIERLVLTVSASIYWLCWVFRNDTTVMTYVMTERADTLMAWFGYYVVPHDCETNALSAIPASASLTTSLTMKEDNPNPSRKTQSKDMGKGSDKDKHENSQRDSIILEYLTKLIRNMVTLKKYHSLLFSGKRPIGITIMRRTIEFLEGILDSTPLPLHDRSPSHPHSLPNPPFDQDAIANTITATIRGDSTEGTVSYSVRMIQLRPVVLEAMLMILLGSINGSSEGTDLVFLHIQNLIHVWLLLLLDLKDLFGVQYPSSAQASLKKIRELSLTLLSMVLTKGHERPTLFRQGIMADVPMSHWTLGYEALVEIIMQPLEFEMSRAETSETTSAIAEEADEMGMKALKVFMLFWKIHPKARNTLADLLGPRLHQLKMVPILVCLPKDSNKGNGGQLRGRDSDNNENSKSTDSGWRKERAMLLLETIVSFGSESSVRIKMREAWSSLAFLVSLLGASMRRLAWAQYSPREKLPRVIAMKCFMALRHFWYDHVGLRQLIDLQISPHLQQQPHNDRVGNEPGDSEDGDYLELWRKLMPSDVAAEYQTTKTDAVAGTAVGTLPSPSIVPVLLSILAPPGTEWTSDFMLSLALSVPGDDPEVIRIRKNKIKRRVRHPLFEQRDPILAEAALILVPLSQFLECQRRLVSKPGAIWMLARLMVERSLIGHLGDPNQARHRLKVDIHHPPGNTTISVDTADENPQTLMEKALFRALSSIFSNRDLAKELVSNNTITEAFAAIMEMDRPLRFYARKMKFEDGMTADTEAVVTDTEEKTKQGVEDTTSSTFGESRDSSNNSSNGHRDDDHSNFAPSKEEHHIHDRGLILNTTFTSAINTTMVTIPTGAMAPTEQIQPRMLPTPHHYLFHQQLLEVLQTIMEPSLVQFERIYQYIGGNRSLQEPDETAESFYWMREYCALILFYLSDRDRPLSRPGHHPSILFQRPKPMTTTTDDKTTYLKTESILGIIGRMLTLEMDYEDEHKEGEEEEGRTRNEGTIGRDNGLLQDTRTTATGNDNSNSHSKEKDLISAQKEEALLRRLSAGLAIQSVCWKHWDKWRQQHQNFVQSYKTVTTTEWKAHVAILNGSDNNNGTNSNGNKPNSLDTPVQIKFLIQGHVISFPDRYLLSRASMFFHTLLVGDFMEATQQHITLHDTDPDVFQMLLEVIQESQMTAQHLLPEDLPFQLVVQLMVCAERYMVVFVRRLAEAWILKTLSRKELQYYDMDGHNNSPVEQDEEEEMTRKQIKTVADSEMTVDRVDISSKIDTTNKHDRESSPQSGGSQRTDKRQKLEKTRDRNEEPQDVEDIITDSNDIEDEDKDEEDESLQECLLMVYEACSDLPLQCSLSSPSHPFHGLVWDSLKRMVLRLGSVAITPRFAAMLNTGDEERIEQFLHIIFNLMMDQIPYFPNITV